MNAHTSIDRRSIELDRFDHMLAMLSAPVTRSLIATGKFWSSELGAQIIDAMQEFTGCDDLERIAENIRHELYEPAREEASDPYFSGRLAPFARALADGGVR